MRGAGSDQTFLIFELQPSAPEYQRTNFWLGNSNTDISSSVIGGCNKGSNVITVADVTGFSIGDLIDIKQDNAVDNLRSFLQEERLLDQAGSSSGVDHQGASTMDSLRAQLCTMQVSKPSLLVGAPQMVDAQGRSLSELKNK